MRNGTILSAALAVSAVVTLISHPASARPLYQDKLRAKYPDNAQAMVAKCDACHIGKPAARTWNGYGEALGKALGGRNIKPGDDILKALDKAAGEKSAIEGKTFGDLLKEGRLPGELPEKKSPQPDKLFSEAR